LGFNVKHRVETPAYTQVGDLKKPDESR
jgi:hypothetical protein